MATTKKTPIKKSSSSAKRNTTKGRAKPLPLTWRFYVVTIGIFLVAVSTAVVIALLAAHHIAGNQRTARLERINDIYASINLDGKEYIVTDKNVFGDKRPYEYDSSRSYSSAIEYLHADTVSSTFAELDAKIKAAGFSFVDEPYPGAAQKQYHYKSADGEYVRLSVSSKPYNDAWQNAMLMTGKAPKNLDTIDKNAGPAAVTLKVNLDDNNE